MANFLTQYGYAEKVFQKASGFRGYPPVPLHQPGGDALPLPHRQILDYEDLL